MSNSLTMAARAKTKKMRNGLFNVSQVMASTANGIRFSIGEMEAGHLSGLDVLLAASRCMQLDMPTFWQEMNLLFEKVLPEIDWSKPSYIIDGEDRYESFEDFYARECEPWMGPLDHFCHVVKQHQDGKISLEDGAERLKSAAQTNRKTVCAIAREQGAPEPKAGPGRGNKTDNNSNAFSKQGNDPVYLARRILGANPEVFEKLEQGEYRSVRSAAIAAGVIKVKQESPLESAQRAWKKMTGDEQQEFLRWISNDA